MTKKLYSFKDHPEHKAQLSAWRDKWILNAMSTKHMDDEEKKGCIEAVKSMYRSANLVPPPDHRIIFVPSPFVLRFASGFASWIWYTRKIPAATRGATLGATYVATRGATEDATEDATRGATYAATYAATLGATEDATDAATLGATYAATRGATDDATRGATDAATDAATKSKKNWFNLDLSLMVKLSKHLGVGKFGLECSIKCYWKMYQGGNHWSAWSAFLTFFRYVAKLDLDYSKFDAFEYLSEHSGPRIMHEKFCMISDRPELLLVDAQNRPHCDNGPFCRWRDGTGLFSIHGVRVPEFVVTNPENITVKDIAEEKNAEVRRIMIQRYRGGVIAYMNDSCANMVKKDKWGTLWVKERKGDFPLVVVEVVNSTPEPDGSFKHYWIRVSSQAYSGDTLKYPQAAIASTWRRKDGSLAFEDWHEYQPTKES